MVDPITTAIANKAATEITDDVAEFAKAVSGRPALEIGETIADFFREFRFRRSIKTFKRAHQQLRDAGIEPDSVKLGTLVPLLDGASLADEDDDDMQDRWASLLANAAKGGDEVPPSFASVLSELEPLDASILDYVYDTMMAYTIDIRKLEQIGINTETMALEMGVAPELGAFHVDNLKRLRLLRELRFHTGDARDLVMFTEFAGRFIRACRPVGTVDLPARYSDWSSVHKAAAANTARVMGSVQTAPLTGDPAQSPTDADHQV